MDAPEEEYEEVNLPQPELDTPVDQIFEQIQMMSLSKHIESANPPLPDLTEKQIDHILASREKAEDNTHAYQMERLRLSAEIESKRIASGSINQRTMRQAILMGIVIFFVLTGGILWLKPEYFQIWLSFIAGIGGGFGLSEGRKIMNTDPPSNPLIDEAPEED